MPEKNTINDDEPPRGRREQSGFAWKHPVRIGIALSCVLAGLIGASFQGNFWGAMNTTFARRDIAGPFKEVVRGDSLDKVYSLLGPPLEITVNPDAAGTESHRRSRDLVVDIDHVKKLMSDPNVSVSLVYSKERTSGLVGYVSYIVVGASEKVSWLHGPVIMD